MRPLVLAMLLTALLSRPACSQELRIITEIYPPYNYTEDGEPTGKPMGLAVDIVREMQKRLGDTTPIEVMPWARGYQTALTKPGVMLFSTTRTEAREHLFKWVGPIVQGDQVFFARKDSPLKVDSLDDAREAVSIGVYRDDVGEQFLKERKFTNLEIVSNPLLLARMLANGRIDLWISGRDVGAFTARQAGVDPGLFRVAYVIETRELYCAFSGKTPDEVVDRWRKAFESMESDGTFKAIVERWFPPFPQEGPPGR